MHRDAFINYKSLPNPAKVKLADGNTIPGEGIGDVEILSEVDGTTTSTLLTDVLYLPGIKESLMSPQAIGKAGGVTIFTSDQVFVQDKSGNTVLNGSLRNNLYTIHSTVPLPEDRALLTVSMQELHDTMGHINPTYLSKMVKNNLITGLEIQDGKMGECLACIRAKATATPVSKHSHLPQATEPLQIIHSDLAGPFNVDSYGGKRFYCSFIDDCTDSKWTYLLTHKSQLTVAYKQFEAVAKKTFPRRSIGILKSDRGGEFISDELYNYIILQGGKVDRTTASSPHQNGKAERWNRTLKQAARAMLLTAGLSMKLWAEAIMYATLLLSASPSKRLQGSSPYSLLHDGQPLDVSKLHPFGCLVEVLITHDNLKPLDSRTWQGHYMGPSVDGPGHRVWNPRTKRVSVSRNVHFLPWIPRISLTNTLPHSVPSPYVGSEISGLLPGPPHGEIAPLASPPTVAPATLAIKAEDTKSKNVLLSIPSSPKISNGHGGGIIAPGASASFTHLDTSTAKPATPVQSPQAIQTTPVSSVPHYLGHSIKVKISNKHSGGNLLQVLLHPLPI